MPEKTPRPKAPSVPKVTAATIEAFHKKLQESALDDQETIEDLHLQPMSAEQAAKLGLSPAKAGFKIPYFDLDGEETKFFRFRYLADTREGFAKLTEKPQRYGQLAGTLNEVYFPPLLDWAAIRADTTYDVWITEGELKAACGCHMGLAVMGLGGVWCFKSTKAHLALLPSLEEFEWTGRRVYVCYDSDASSNTKVMQAETALCRELTLKGAVPTVVRLPAKADGRKNGLDDFLVERGPAALEQIRKQSFQFADALALHELNEEVVYIRDPGLVVKLSDFQKMAPREFVAHQFADKHLIRTSEQGKLVRVSAPQEWIKWPGRAAMQTFDYSPGQPATTYDEFGRPTLNTWRGWGCESRKGDVSLWQELLDFLTCGDKTHRVWLERWFAYPIQNPGAKMSTAVIMWGRGQGTGKSLLGYSAGKVYGEKNFSKINKTELTGNFNGWAEDKQFILAEEITSGDKRDITERLKDMITERETTVNVKYIPAFRKPSRANFYFTSNHADAFFLDEFDRRFFVQEAPQKPREQAFYRRYADWIFHSEEGPAALRYHLEHLPLGDFDPMAKALQTEAKAAMIVDTMSDIDKWVHDLQRDPDTCLRMGETVLKMAYYSTPALLMVYDPDGKKKLTANGLARALKRSGLNPVGILSTREGKHETWCVRPRPTEDAQAVYWEERNMKPPALAVKKGAKK